VASEHAIAATASDTRWDRICDHYATLVALNPSPAVRLAAAVALAERDGPHAGLAALDDLDGAMPHSHRLPAVRASCSPGSGSTPRPSSRSTWRSPAAATRSSATT
jgi:predicted RNA polymerase sigma factor